MGLGFEIRDPEKTYSGSRIQGSKRPRIRIRNTVKNHLNEEINPLLPTGIGERYSQTMSNLEQAALLRRFELPL